jgi:hypothetical protein
MSVVVSGLPNAFAREVSGVRCTGPLMPEDVEAIHEGMAKSGALTIENMDRLPGRGQRHRGPGVRPSQSAEVAFTSWSATCTSR